MTKSTTLYSNNARSALSASITNSATTLTVINGLSFPVTSAGTDCFFVTLDDGVNLEIIKVGSRSGNTLSSCVRGQEGTTASAFTSGTPVENRLTAGNISAFARLQDRVANISSIETLAGPGTQDGNSYLCASTDAIGDPILAMANGTTWRLVNYPEKVLNGTVGSSATTTSITITNIGDLLIDATGRVYVIQFTSGTYIGQLRFVTSVATNVVNFTTALAGTPSSLDTYEIYRCISAWKAPTGGNSDRIFFENDAQIWASYSIPSGRNASSTGPVYINGSASVSVPSGSSWSII